jgi:peptidoglycan/xylan/chitin deacetylase (PgdA/CDA1 family)
MRLKDAVFHAAKSLGLFAAVRASAWRRRRLLILCYHGVSAHDEHEWSPLLYVTPEKLRSRLQQLRDDGYNILPLAEAVRRVYDGTLPEKCVAITFDDGATDFETKALPILREFNAPATLYLTTYYCDHRLPVFSTVLAYVLYRGRHSDADLASIVGGSERLTVREEANRNRTYERIVQFAKSQGLDAREKNTLAMRIAELLGVDYEEIVRRGTLAIMSPESVQRLPADLVDVQLHTHRHRTPRDREAFLREIRDNASRISALRGAGTLEHFCYPSGQYFGEFFDWLGECDVRFATTCVPGYAQHKTHPMLIPRFVDTMMQSDIAFEAWVSGFAAFVPLRAESRLDPERLIAAGS